jgi:hypothetical protein
MMLPESAQQGPEAAPGIASVLPAADGAGRMLLELKQQFDLIYPETTLGRYRLVVLPDRGYLDEAACRSLAAFLQGGGAILLSHHAGLLDGRFTCPGTPVRYVGPHPFKPCYLTLGRELGRGLPDSAFVMYEDCAQVAPVAGARAMGRLWTTYFNRAYDHFCSHHQTPCDRLTRFPVAVTRGRVGYIAGAVFQAYKDHAYPVYKEVVSRLLERLMPDPLVRVQAPSAMEVSMHRQRQPRRAIVHLVNFQPQRRHVHVEWIEALYPVRDIALSVRTGRRPTTVYLAPSRRPLEWALKGDRVELTVPEVRVHEMVVLEGV